MRSTSAASRDCQPRDAGASSAVVSLAVEWYGRLAQAARPGAGARPAGVRALHAVLVLRLCEARNLVLEESLRSVVRHDAPWTALDRLFRVARQRYGKIIPKTLEPWRSCLGDRGDLLAELIGALYAPGASQAFATAPIEALGQAYEQCLAVAEQGGKRAGGVYYTPSEIARRLVEQTLGRLCAEATPAELGQIRILDPACGAGVFLLCAYERLLAAHLSRLVQQPALPPGRVISVAGAPRLTVHERQRILQRCIFGVDRDEHAVEITRLSLHLKSLEALPAAGEPLAGAGAHRSALADNIQCGDSLLSPDFAAHAREADAGRARDGERRFFDWKTALAPVREGGFHVVLGNPPWGQKAIVASGRVKSYLRQKFPSSRGIFDWFRPFVELGVRLTRPGGSFGMVLPDIVLLKNYEPTRRFLLEHLALTDIEWLGMAFSGAVIDAVNIAGLRAPAGPDHQVHVVVGEPGRSLEHWIPQQDFWANPRCTFNLSLTEPKRRVLCALRTHPRLGDFFEVHEGVHSGNIRAELFVHEPLDATCRELLFGRDELRPYLLRWSGRYVRLSAVPAKRTRARYANLGKRAWYEQPKLVVRRTGDQVTAAVDRQGRFASNNFFVVLPKARHPLDLDGLCALLNSGLMTWFFRTIEPRQGRAFAELKIKHIREFPLPHSGREKECAALSALGAERREAAYRSGDTPHAPALAELDAEIERTVLRLLGLQDHAALAPLLAACGESDPLAADAESPNRGPPGWR